jgi:6-pyruvoyltetrahydropterin/6-carboxytetrahydropterin synthase
MYSLGMKRTFSARHYLIGGDWGDENIEHSHQYTLELILEAKELDQHGFLIDIVEVERHLEEVVALFDKKTLNTLDSFSAMNPSIERLATVMHTLFSERLAHYQLEAISVTLWEDQIAWTSFRSHP